MLIIFKHCTRFVHYNIAGRDRIFKKFTGMCDRCWSKGCGFLTINLTLNASDEKYMDKFEAITY